MNDSIWSTFIYIVIMIAVIIGAYYTTKLLSRRVARIQKTRYIHIYDRVSLSKDKQIILLEVGGKIFLVGSTNQNISVIGTLDKESVDTEEQEKSQTSKQSMPGKIMEFFVNAKKAQTDLYNARKQSKSKPDNLNDDILEKMSRSAQMWTSEMQSKHNNDSQGPSI